MPPDDRKSLWYAAIAAGDLSERFLAGPNDTVTLSGLCRGSMFGGRLEEFRGRSVLISTTDQLTAALALLELDGAARRLILYPPDLPWEHADFVATWAEVDAVISDRPVREIDGRRIDARIVSGPTLEAAPCDRTAVLQTEWVLLTSGTTGRPKMVLHTLESLTGAIHQPVTSPPMVWSTFYDIRRYGGLQILLRAMLGRASLVLSSAGETTADFLMRCGRHSVTHISGTPSHWRRALMSPSAAAIAPQCVRLSGEIADQSILDSLRVAYPTAAVGHAFASTEAGVAFEVGDGFAGFPASLITGQQTPGIDMKVEDGSLRIRSARNAVRYLGPENAPIADADGFVDTGDMLELRDGRYYFIGRKDGVINVGGMKVYPEEVEAVINRHPRVRASLVRTRKNPITGALVVAEVVLKTEADRLNENSRQLETEILQLCRETLSRHKVPAAIRLVPSVAVSASGKMVRCHA